MEEVNKTVSESKFSDRVKKRLANILLPNSFNHIEQLQSENVALTLRLEKLQNRLDTDQGILRAGTWANLITGDYNPDEVGLEEYTRMILYDSQVRAGFDLISMGVLMKPWRIRHPDEEVVATLTAALRRLKKPSVRDSMKQMLTSIVYGYSVTEIVFDDYKNYWMPRQTNGMKTLDPVYIKFFSDEYGNLHKVEQQIPVTVGLSTDGYPTLPLDRTLIWSHDMRFGNWYGESILGACYKNWYIKDAMMKFANIAYERFGAPVYLGFASSIKDMNNIEEAIEHLYSYSQATILKRGPDDSAGVEILESKRAEMPFDRYIRYQDEMILRRMLIGQKLFEGGGGTYGPKVPFDIILMRFEDFRMELVEQMNQMLSITAELNWDLAIPPMFEFAPLTTSDAATLRTAIFDALDREILELPSDKEWIRQELGFPQGQKEQKFAQALPGRYLRDPHASWLASKKKTIIVSSSPESKYANQEIYIVGDGGIYGIMKEGTTEGPFSRAIQAKYETLHLISAAEWNDKFPRKRQFWILRPEIITSFDTPLRFSVPDGVTTYISRVIPEAPELKEGG